MKYGKRVIVLMLDELYMFIAYSGLLHTSENTKDVLCKQISVDDMF